jgi:hypothetical protein
MFASFGEHFRRQKPQNHQPNPAPTDSASSEQLHIPAQLRETLLDGRIEVLNSPFEDIHARRFAARRMGEFGSERAALYLMAIGQQEEDLQLKSEIVTSLGVLAHRYLPAEGAHSVLHGVADFLYTHSLSNDRELRRSAESALGAFAPQARRFDKVIDWHDVATRPFNYLYENSRRSAASIPGLAMLPSLADYLPAHTDVVKFWLEPEQEIQSDVAQIIISAYSRRTKPTYGLRNRIYRLACTCTDEDLYKVANDYLRAQPGSLLDRVREYVNLELLPQAKRILGMVILRWYFPQK